MCGRFVSRTGAAVEREYQLVGSRVHWRLDFESYNVAPTQPVPVVRLRGGEREALDMRWGLVPWFEKGVPPKYSTHIARIESFRGSPAYRAPWERGQRCLILARGFYEWHEGASGKQPFYVHCADQETFSFAGLWDRSIAADGKVIESCTLITLPANELMRSIHNGGNSPYRMPAILAPEDRDVWLVGRPEEAFATLKPYPDAVLVAWPVSRRVNSAKNDAPDLLEPLPAETVAGG